MDFVLHPTDRETSCTERIFMSRIHLKSNPTDRDDVTDEKEWFHDVHNANANAIYIRTRTEMLRVRCYCWRARRRKYAKRVKSSVKRPPKSVTRKRHQRRTRPTAGPRGRRRRGGGRGTPGHACNYHPARARRRGESHRKRIVVLAPLIVQLG